MSIVSDVNGIWLEKGERELFFEARAILQNASTVADEARLRYTEIAALGTFDTLPSDLKDAMIAWDAMFDVLYASFLANADVIALYQWTPPSS